MTILSNLFLVLAEVFNVFIMALYWLILIRAVISWVNPDPHNPVVRFLYRTTEPILNPIRRFFPGLGRLGIDISPFIAFLVLVLLRSSVVAVLRNIVHKLH